MFGRSGSAGPARPVWLGRSGSAGLARPGNYIFKTYLFNPFDAKKYSLQRNLTRGRDLKKLKMRNFWIWIRGRPLAAISKLSLGNPSKVSSRDRKWSLDHRESDESSAGSIKTSFKSPELRCQNFLNCRRPVTGRNFEVESWKPVKS